jgi:DNA repair exonuclease SbcCD ATPase subunit
MSQATSFWRRIGSLFGVSTVGDEPDGNALGGNESRVVQAVEGSDSAAYMGSSGGLLARFRRNDPRAAQLAGYQRIAELMDSLQEHYRQQDERAARMEQQTERISSILQQLADSGRQQQEHVRTMTDNVSQATRHSAAMSESLSLLPPLLQAEADAVRSMVRQMDVAQESDTQLMQSLQKLGQAVESLNGASNAQVQTLERLSAAEREQRQALTLLVREQTRRFLVIMLVAAILGVGALAALSAMLIVRFYH